MKPHYKILLGAFMILAGIWWYTQDFLVEGFTNLESLGILFTGGFGAFIILIGIFIVWIESDELKVQKELEKTDFEPVQYKTGTEFVPEKEEISLEDSDYEEIVDKTVEEVKEEVEEKDLDLEKLLEAETNNKDRKTLKEWIKRRM